MYVHEKFYLFNSNLSLAEITILSPIFMFKIVSLLVSKELQFNCLFRFQALKN